MRVNKDRSLVLGKLKMELTTFSKTSDFTEAVTVYLLRVRAYLEDRHQLSGYRHTHLSCPVVQLPLNSYVSS